MTATTKMMKLVNNEGEGGREKLTRHTNGRENQLTSTSNKIPPDTRQFQLRVERGAEKREECNGGRGNRKTSRNKINDLKCNHGRPY